MRGKPTLIIGNLNSDSLQRQYFIEACNAYGLTSVQAIIEELDNFKKCDRLELGLINLVRYYSRSNRKNFYKAIERAFILEDDNDK